MKEFIEKWKTDSKFKAKIQLGLYVIFMISVTIFATTGRAQTYTDETATENNENTNINIVNLPEEYKYTINIELNNKKYKYVGKKAKEKEEIQKITDDKTIEYIYDNKRYFKNTMSPNNIVDQEEVYNIIDYNYLNLETVNKYLSIAHKEEDKYVIYIKDIILGSTSEEYITIQIDKNKTNIDYTSLLQLFDNSINSCNVEVIIIEE